MVKGYEEDGKKIPFETTFAGLYEKAKEEKNRFPSICRSAGSTARTS